MIEFIYNAPEWLQICFLASASVGAWLMWRYKKIVFVVALGAIALYKEIKGDK